MSEPKTPAVTGELIVKVEQYDAPVLSLQMAWLTGEQDGMAVDLTCGAGLGSPYMHLTVRRVGEPTIYERVDMREVVQDWTDAAIARRKERD